jgi:hypothetical protein
MPYENVPTTNAPPIPPRPDEYTFTFDISGFLPDGVTPRSTIDDLDMFSPENQTSNKQMLDYLDRVVTRVTLRGEQLVTRTTVKETYEEGGETKERDRIVEAVEGVRGKGIPYVALKQLMAGIGEALKEANNPGN